MKIDWLIDFETVVEQGSFSKAAEVRYLSQSSLSKNIISLENELGNQLFFRKSNKVELTPYGQYISSYISKLIDDYHLLNLSTSNFELSKLKSLKIATMFYAALLDILGTVIRFEKENPDFYIETVETSHSKMLPLLNSRQIELAFGYRELLGSISNYDACFFFHDPLVFITSRKHADETGYPDKITINHIKKDRFCFPREDIKLFDYIISYCTDHDFRPKLTLSNVRLETIRHYIFNDMRSTIYPRSIANIIFQAPDFVLLPFDDNPSLDFCMYINQKSDHRVKSDLVDYVKNSFSHSPSDGTP